MLTKACSATAALALLALAACSPGAPEGVDKAALDDAVSRAIGDPNSCLMIAEADGGEVVYRYNSATACANEWPACEGQGARKLKDLVELTAKDRQVRSLSCDSSIGGRSVGWSAGPVPGKPYVYAAVMEGERAFPGMMMADRIASAFRKAGLTTG